MYGNWSKAVRKKSYISGDGLLVECSAEQFHAGALKSRSKVPAKACGVSLAFLQRLHASLEFNGMQCITSLLRKAMQCDGGQCSAWQGKARQGKEMKMTMARQGKARQDNNNDNGNGKARQGKTMTRTMARQSKARQGKENDNGKARQGKART
ncbi:hypothetical protein DUNSADRAFT_7036 [Dunaliella salina]|uniref:Encoded protein n=1 Tax=Dunaliella salina TaxID=3046 RepID=A0ABQ7GM42_DUNSA|nr:hypothetical protein DUNSADRAFT_7036 [Dunaliella salina]|eukprot:KAF5835676.1 hypothetical protein DUNSADRAFT_7036 [Dunaliella salina]